MLDVAPTSTVGAKKFGPCSDKMWPPTNTVAPLATASSTWARLLCLLRSDIIGESAPSDLHLDLTRKKVVLFGARGAYAGAFAAPQQHAFGRAFQESYPFKINTGTDQRKEATRINKGSHDALRDQMTRRAQTKEPTRINKGSHDAPRDQMIRRAQTKEATRINKGSHAAPRDQMTRRAQTKGSNER